MTCFVASQFEPMKSWVCQRASDIAGASPFAGKDEGNEEQIEEELKEHGIEDVANFGLEKHLEDFLIANWGKTIFGKKYQLIYNEGDLESQQYPTVSGPIDILARNADESEYLVIELKKGRSSDSVVAQIQRYIAWVKQNIGKGKKVKGAIVVLEADENLKLSLSESASDITLYNYKVDFDLIKQELI